MLVSWSKIDERDSPKDLCISSNLKRVCPLWPGLTPIFQYASQLFKLVS